jgi:hypothetical protein
VKKLLKLLSLVQAVRHGHPPYGAGAYQPFKGKKWKKRERYRRYGAYGGHPPHGYGSSGYDPYGHPRPRGLKGMIVEAILHRLLRR